MQVNEQILLHDIDKIIAAIKALPDVKEVDVQDGDSFDNYKKKVFVTFAGHDEDVIVELY